MARKSRASAIAADTIASDFYVLSGLDCFLFAQSDPGNFRIGVKTGRDHPIFHSLFFADDVFGSNHPLFCGNMGQLDFSGDVTNGIDVRDIGSEIRINFNK